MAYGIKYRIKYCDKNNIEAKVEIEVRGYAGAVQNVEGTPDVFLLRYDLGGKQNNIISSFADINLFENPITIDDLKTLNETDIRVSFYLANDLKWQGFALPDFFETDIKNNAVISISATDRLSVLKDKTIGGFEVNVTPMRLISEVLNQTGLALSINSVISFSASGVTDVMRHLTLNGQRLTDDRGRNISAYDILSSLLALFNSYIVQRNNEWYIINKWQLENGGGTLYKYNSAGAYQSSSTFTPTQINFDEISAGGRRKIEAGALEVSLFGEYGGMPIYPNNYDFRLWGLSGFDGWSAKNDFVAMMNENEVTGYSGNSAIIGSGSVNRRLRFKHEAYVPDPYIGAYFESDEWVSLLGNEANINISINATSKNKTVFGVGVIVKDADGNLWTQNASNTWKKRDSQYAGGIYMPIVFDDENAGADDVVSISANIGASIKASDLGDDVLSLSGASAKFVIFGTALNAADVFISSAKIAISQSGDQPQGTLFKVQQQNDFSKKFDTQTIIFSDYVQSGINGHFYPYRSDDTSIIRPITKFSANGETDYLALLSARQSSRLFSSARDVLTITIDANSIDPLAVYVCGSKKYIATESVFDFFRSKLDLRLEENVVNNTAKKDFVYSYFGEGDDSVRSVGGISGGGISTGSGSSAPQYWQLDEEGNLFTEYNAYSTQELSAYGLGSGSGGGDGSLVIWGTEANGGVGLTVDGIIKTLALKSGLDLKQDKLIAGSGITIVGNTISSTATGGGGSTVEWGTLTNGYRQLTVEGVTYALAQNTHKHLWADITDKPSTFTPSAHTHSAGNITSGTFAIGRIPTGTTGTTVALGNHLHTGVYEPVFTKNSAFNKNFGTTAGTVAQGNDSRITNGQTAYGWGNHATAGYALNSALSNYVPTSRTITAGNGLSGGGTLSADRTLTLATPSTLTAATTNGVTASSHTHAITTTSVGDANTIIQTDATGGTKLNNLMVGGDWKLEQVGTELQLKYNNVVAQRFLLDGSIVGLGEITAYGASTGGEGVALLRTGGTMIGDLVLNANLGIASKALTLLGNSFKYNGSNVLTEANTATQIKMGNGWTIEQTTSALTIRKNGVIKGTFNA